LVLAESCELLLKAFQKKIEPVVDVGRIVYSVTPFLAVLLIRLWCSLLVRFLPAAGSYW
jgi:uncharacterized protein involved in cysteine biosynthesis